ncbi:oxidation resistance protein 1-like isoform X1 [Saccostrea cucullata]|uniref:oxidation resistance protein 1-like isoform X1 n=1 Tax=Saccostrea cuccullata TaxID=36930 RepID=UPI002ED3C762
MATKRPSLKDRMIEKIHSGTARFRTGSTEDLSTGSDSERKNPHTTKWYTHPQSEAKTGEGQVEKVKATIESVSSDTVKNGKKPKKVQPEGTVEYKVSENDTLVSIAAHFDTTPTALQKLNKMFTRNVFAGQTLYVPDGSVRSKVEESIEKSHTQVASPKKDLPNMDLPLIKMADKPPARVPGHVERVPTPLSSPTEKAEFEIPHKLSEEEARELDQECYERFIKVSAKHITDGQGVVSGVLLVTPNAVMFDPNVSDPLVLEHGAERYGVVAPMDMVISAAMYHDIAAMKAKGLCEGGKKPEVYHDKSCTLFKSWCEGHPNFEVARAASDAGFTSDRLTISDHVSTPTKVTASPQSDSASLCSCSASQGEGGASTTSSPVKGDNGQSSAVSNTPGRDKNNEGEFEITSANDFGEFVSSESDLQEFEKVNSSSPGIESKKNGTNKSNNVSRHSEKEKDLITFGTESESKPMFFSGNESDRINDPSPVPGTSPNEMRIGNIVYHNLPVSESSKGQVTAKDIENAQVALSKLSVEEFEQQRSRSTPVDIPVVQQPSQLESRSASFGSFNVAPHLNAFVNYATGLFKNSEVKDIGEVTQDNEKGKTDILDIKGKSDMIKQRLRSLGSSPKEKSDPMGADLEVEVENAVKLADKPELFQSFDKLIQSINDQLSWKYKLIPRPAVAAEDPPLYLCLHLGKPVNKHVSETAPIQAYTKKKKKPEYWFSIPREKVDQLYAFFVQWKPELYGDDEEISAERRGFVVLDEDDPDEMEVFEEYFSNGLTALQKDWEIISAEEASRRKSEPEETPILPELHGQSTIVQDYHVLMLSRHMPARTIGYPWTLIYSTEQHGFSLKTLYRDMQGVDSPVMLLVKDTNDNIFGAVTSCELKPSDHFYGTGESFLFTFYPEFKVFRWTGDNNFFIKGNQESLSIGAGQGLFGLWFDGDLYHGQTHHCDTYDNDVLTSSEDFIVKVLEAWIFSQD